MCSSVIVWSAALTGIGGIHGLDAATFPQDDYAEVVEHHLDGIPFWSARQSLRVVIGPDHTIFLTHPELDDIRALSREGVPLASIPLLTPDGSTLAPLSDLYVRGDSLVATNSTQRLRVVFGLDGIP